MGKTGLIQHCFHTKEIKQNYYPFFIDIYATGSLKEFIYVLGKQIFEALKPRRKQFLEIFFQTVTSLRPAYKLDSLTGTPVFDIGIGEIRQPEFSLGQIFAYLESADKPCIVAIDEFQQISKYPEKNIEAILRTHIQQCRNTSFIFSGSLRHIMINMFFSVSRPFYQSVSLLNLPAIDVDRYILFIQKHFKKAGKKISDENIRQIYNLFEGHTWYIHNVFNRLYSFLDENEEASSEIINHCLRNTISLYETMFQGILSLLPERQKELLYAIAKEGKASEITSAAFIKKHSLLSSSSVQTATKQLLEKELITKENNIYQIYDRFFGLWLSEMYGTGYQLLW
jgi:hypothetical protein